MYMFWKGCCQLIFFYFPIELVTIFSMTMTENYDSDNGKNNYDDDRNNDDNENV